MRVRIPLGPRRGATAEAVAVPKSRVLATIAVRPDSRTRVPRRRGRRLARRGLAQKGSAVVAVRREIQYGTGQGCDSLHFHVQRE